MDVVGHCRDHQLSAMSAKPATKRVIWTTCERPSGTRKHAKANMQYETKSLREIRRIGKRSVTTSLLEENNIDYLMEEKSCSGSS